MNRHPSDEALWSYVNAGDGDPDGEVARHLRAGCPRCDTRLHGLSEMQRLLATPPLDPVPEAWARAARERLQARLRADHPSSVKKQLQTSLRELRAALTLDTVDPTALVGIRAAVPGPRTLLFECEAGEVYLQVLPRSSRMEVRGQVLLVDSDLPRGTRVRLDRAGPKIARRVDGSGSFVLPLLDPGQSVTLRLELPNLVVILDPFDI